MLGGFTKQSAPLSSKYHDVIMFPDLVEGKCEFPSLPKPSLPQLPTHFITRPKEMKGTFPLPLLYLLVFFLHSFIDITEL